MRSYDIFQWRLQYCTETYQSDTLHNSIESSDANAAKFLCSLIDVSKDHINAWDGKLLIIWEFIVVKQKRKCYQT